MLFPELHDALKVSKVPTNKKIQLTEDDVLHITGLEPLDTSVFVGFAETGKEITTDNQALVDATLLRDIAKVFLDMADYMAVKEW